MITTLQQPAATASTETQSGFLLLPGFIGFVFAFRACFTVLLFQNEPEQGSIVSVALSLLLLTVAALFTIGSKPSIPASSFRNSTLRWIAAFLGLNLASLLWTTAPLDATASYCAAWIADIATAWFILRAGNALVQAEAVMKGYIWGACAVAAVAWLLPTMPDLRIGDEIFLHPNTIGLICATAILMAMYMAHQNKNWRWTALWLTLTLMRTISKTSIIAFFVAMTFYLVKDTALTRAARIWVGITGGVILAALSGLLFTYFNTYAESASPETLTGRTVLWAVTGELALERPIFGHGLYSYRFLVPPFGTFEPQHAHNELLQQFFVLGAVGLILVLCLFWTFFRKIRNAPPSNLKTLAAALLILALIRGFADTQAFDLSFPLWLMTIFSILLTAQTHPAEDPAEPWPATT